MPRILGVCAFAVAQLRGNFLGMSEGFRVVIEPLPLAALFNIDPVEET